MQRRIYGHATDVEIRPLNEEKAVQAAVDLIGELFVFSVCNLIIAFSLNIFCYALLRFSKRKLTLLVESAICCIVM